MNRTQLMQTIKTNLGTVNTSVEVGAYRGDFSAEMISALQPVEHIAVDQYKWSEHMISAPGPEFQNQQTLNTLAQQVSNRMQGLGHKLIRGSSVDVAMGFDDETLDVVYLDGDHTYDGVNFDIQAWLPKVKSGGYICGHDYCEGTTGGGYAYGVIDAVNEVFSTVDVTNDNPPSWYVRKA